MVNVWQLLSNVADTGVLEATPEALEGILSYELWRAAFVDGTAFLVTARGQTLTAKEAQARVAQRRRKLRKAGR